MSVPIPSIWRARDLSQARATRACATLSHGIPLIPLNPGESRVNLTRNSHQCHGLRGAVRPTGQERRAARCGASGKRRDELCRPDSAALRVAPRRPPAASRASTVFPDTLFGPLLADRTSGCDADHDIGEKSGLILRPPEAARDRGGKSESDTRKGASWPPPRRRNDRAGLHAHSAHRPAVDPPSLLQPQSRPCVAPAGLSR